MAYVIPLIKNPFYKNLITKRMLAEFVSTTNTFSMGLNCAKFGNKFSDFQKRKYTILFNSGSSANFALIQALLNLEILKPGNNIGFTSIGWPTTVMPLMQLGLIPVQIDIDLKCLNSTLETIRKVSSELQIKGKKLKAIFITNVLGFCGDIDAIKKYCRDNNILLLEDNCESLGSEYKGTKLGNFGFASTFSFFVGHHFSCIEGGAVCTNDKRLSDMLTMVRSHGWDRNLDHKSQRKLRKQYEVDDFDAKYTFYTIGMNIRPTEITGFLGLTQLKYLNKIIKRRNENYQLYLDAVSKKFYKILNVYQNRNITINSNFAFPLIFKEKKDTEEAKKIFFNSGIEIRPIIGRNLTEQPFFKKSKKYNFQVPNAQLASRHGFYFGNDPSFTRNELNHIIDTINKI